jgi:hypothetical protein
VGGGALWNRDLLTPLTLGHTAIHVTLTVLLGAAGFVFTVQQTLSDRAYEWGFKPWGAPFLALTPILGGVLGLLTVWAALDPVGSSLAITRLTGLGR